MPLLASVYVSPSSRYCSLLPFAPLRDFQPKAATNPRPGPTACTVCFAPVPYPSPRAFLRALCACAPASLGTLGLTVRNPFTRKYCTMVCTGPVKS